jgi:hypothetical protein
VVPDRLDREIAVTLTDLPVVDVTSDRAREALAQPLARLLTEVPLPAKLAVDALGRGMVGEAAIAETLALAGELYAALAASSALDPIGALIEPEDSPESARFALIGAGADPYVMTVAAAEIDDLLDSLEGMGHPMCRTLGLVYSPIADIPRAERDDLRARGWTHPMAVEISATDHDGIPAPFDEDELRRFQLLGRALLAGGLREPWADLPGSERAIELEPGRKATLRWTGESEAHAFDGDVLELEVTLDGTEPAVRRVLEVRGGLTFGDLHAVLQAAMGWENCHPHEFEIGDRRFGQPPEDDPPTAEDEDGVRLDELLRGGTRFTYVYDFGDEWRHTIEVTGRRPAEDDTPGARCTGGARACPPEDSGGAHGYQTLLAAIDDRRHPEHRRAKEWREEGFDPDAFDAAEASAAIAASLDGFDDELDDDEDDAIPH